MQYEMDDEPFLRFGNIPASRLFYPCLLFHVYEPIKSVAYNVHTAQTDATG